MSAPDHEAEIERLRTDLRNVQRNTAQYVQHARAEVVEANKRAAEATRRADATAEANRRLLTVFENPALATQPATSQEGEVTQADRDCAADFADAAELHSVAALLRAGKQDGHDFIAIATSYRLAATPTPPAAERLQELVAMLEASTLEDGVRVYEHDAEEIGIATMDCGADVLAALAAPTPPSQVEHLREALEWYADPANWWVRNSQARGYHRMNEGSMERHAGQPGTVTDGSDQMLRDQFIPDAGGRARAALARAPEVKR